MAVRLVVTGMSCAACQARVEKAVSKVPGAENVSVNLLTGDLRVEGTAGEEDVKKAVIDAGYGIGENAGTGSGDTAGTAEGAGKAMDPREKKILTCLVISICFTAFLMVRTMGMGKHGIVEAGIALVVMLVNRRFFVSGIKAVIAGSPNMDTLVSLGSAASFLGGYYDSAAMILTLITVGKLLEEKTKGRTTNAVKELLRLKPQTARVMKDGAEAVVPATEVKPGDTFYLKPGDSIPADGTVISGNSFTDESMLTGESAPAWKKPGDPLFAATVNRSGMLTCRADKTGKDTAFSEILRMVEDAGSTKAPIARLADKVAGVFVPVVLGIALLTLIVWCVNGEPFVSALRYAISVLVISCPCAMGLATPAAIMTGNGAAAKNGILFKTAQSLEQTGKVRIAAFDKTGTVTRGTLSLVGIFPEEGVTKEELLTAALAAELKSEHPIAKAVVDYAALKNIPAPEVTEFTATGSSVSVLMDGSRIEAGGVPGAGAKISEGSREGKTPVYFTKDGKPLGYLEFADVLKEDAAEAIRLLKEMGITPVMITGDHRETAQVIAKKAGIERVHAGVLPGEKAELIRTLRKEGPVMMVGDGINDAVALKEADIGAGLRTGTDVAMSAADVVLVRPDLFTVPDAIYFSRKVVKNIKENLFWAFFYNVICIPLAAGCFVKPLGISLNPMIGAACMSCSSLFVVCNALRLSGLKSLKEGMKKMTTEIKIEGMMCPHCEARVKEALLKVAGVEGAEVSHEKGNAVVTGNASKEALVKAVTEAGYKVL
ncbi:MAG: heavy metal translocating P-type ATPase [Eubacteriales bacterium]|nr:heavy metal translocating P-type ATPase [Eubacteriales bacterium]